MSGADRKIATSVRVRIVSEDRYRFDQRREAESEVRLSVPADAPLSVIADAAAAFAAERLSGRVEQ